MMTSLMTGFHSKINRSAGKMHLNVWQFIALIKNEELSVRCDEEMCELGEQIKRKVRKYEKLQQRITNLYHRLDTKSITASDFISSVAKNLAILV